MTMKIDPEELKRYLTDNLRLETQSHQAYTGGMDGPLYVTRHSVQLILEGDVISEVSLS
mgnify:FL=1